MKTISFKPYCFDRYIECSNLMNNGNLLVENKGGAYIGNFPSLKKREVSEENYYIVAGRWRLKNNKMNNTMQRRLNRERIIKNILWCALFLLTAYFIFGCSSDDDCECFKETYSKEIEHLYDTPADPSKCKGDAALFNDDFGTMYRYQCK